MTDQNTQCWRTLLEAAQEWLRQGKPAYANSCVRHALEFANRLSPEHRRATLRILNWTRSAARANGRRVSC